MAADTHIHPTAVIEDGAEIGAGTKIGPYSVIGAGVRLGERCELGPHVVISGRTTMGDENQVSPFVSIGGDAQDLKYAGEETQLVIGSRNRIRESVTMNRGTAEGGGLTSIGDDCLFMAYSHVAHDCRVGDGVVLANCAAPAGHVELGDYAIIGGLAAVHQHTRVGAMAFVGGGAMVVMDVPPYCVAVGDRAKLQGVNVVGLRRSGMDEQAVRDVRTSYRIFFQSGLRMQDALEKLHEEYAESKEVGLFIRFIEESKRGVCR
jgi:UDP-N-acetylglucosamine acyltransferase